jgi:hypothetical protein
MASLLWHVIRSMDKASSPDLWWILNRLCSGTEDLHHTGLHSFKKCQNRSNSSKWEGLSSRLPHD